MSGKRRNSTIDQKSEVENGETLRLTKKAKWKTAKLYDSPKKGRQFLYNGQLSTSRCIKTVIIFQQQFVFNIEINGSV